ncbi:MAG: hypothetical protein ACK448_04935 [Bacteroidota bacterium]|jgi:hypothetical protein
MIGWYKINDSVRRLLSLSAISTCLVILSSCEPEPEPALLYNDNVIPFEIVEETFRLGARSTAWISNKSVITRTFKLPPRTVYWAYWMGAGPEPVAELAKVVIPAAASKLTKDPFVAYAWGLLGALNLVNSGTSSVDLFVLPSSESGGFNFQDTFQSFIAKPQTKNIHDKYIDILDTPTDSTNSITLGLRNPNYGAGVDVKMKIWAFVVKPL